MSAHKPSPKFGWHPEETAPPVELFDVSIIPDEKAQVVRDEADRLADAFKMLEEAILEQRELLELLAKLAEWDGHEVPPRFYDPLEFWEQDQSTLGSVTVGDTATGWVNDDNQWHSWDMSKSFDLVDAHDHSYQTGSLISDPAAHSHTLAAQDIQGHTHGHMVTMSYAPTGTNEAMVHSILEGNHKPLTASDEAMIEIYSRYTGGN